MVNNPGKETPEWKWPFKPGRGPIAWIILLLQYNQANQSHCGKGQPCPHVDLCIWKWSMFCNIPTFDCCLKWFIRLVKPAVCWERRSHLGEWWNISPTENVASGCTFREIWNVLVVFVIEKCEMYCLSCRPIITLLYKLKHGQPNSCMALLLVFDVTWTCIRIIKPSRNYSRDE